MSWEVWTMKSRISFCDKTVLRKDILRFAPLWGIYFVGGLLVMLTLSLEENAHTLAQALGICIGIFSIINMIYAALVAQMLFGDLYNSRMCGALHAMPVNREPFFGSHTAAAIAFGSIGTSNAIGSSASVMPSAQYTLPMSAVRMQTASPLILPAKPSSESSL